MIPAISVSENSTLRLMENSVGMINFSWLTGDGEATVSTNRLASFSLAYCSKTASCACMPISLALCGSDKISSSVSVNLPEIEES